MHRWALAFLVLAVAGCGKSFQEADAIYKDEVAKLERLNADCAEIAILRAQKIDAKRRNDSQTGWTLGRPVPAKSRSIGVRQSDSPQESSAKYQELLDGVLAEVKQERADEIHKQEQRVERARAAREAAKR